MVGGPSQASPGRLSPDNQALWRPLIPPASTQASYGNCKTGPAPGVPQGNVASEVEGLWAGYGAERRTPKELSHYLSLDAFLQPPQHGHHRRERAAPVASPLKVLEAGWLGMRSARTSASGEVTGPASRLPPLNSRETRQCHARTHAQCRDRPGAFIHSCIPSFLGARHGGGAGMLESLPRSCGGRRLDYRIYGEGDIAFDVELGGVRLSVRTLSKSGGQ